MTKLQEVFIRNLREERQRAGLSQEQLAERIGITAKYLGVLERGVKFPSVSTMERISKALEIPPYRLFFDGKLSASTPPRDMVETYNRLLQKRYKSDLAKAMTDFLSSLKHNRGDG